MPESLTDYGITQLKNKQGYKTINFDFPEYMYERETNKSPTWYAKIVGNMASYNKYKKVKMYAEKQ